MKELIKKGKQLIWWNDNATEE